MVHLAPSSPGRRRFDLIIGGFLAILGIAVAVLAVVALGKPQSHQAAKAALTPTSSAASLSPEVTSSAATSATGSPTPSTSKSTSSSAPASSSAAVNVKAVPLVVLNATTQNGLAAAAAQRFQAGGWTVTSEGNLSNDILSTCAYYDPSDPRNQVAAQALMTQFPAIKRIKEKFSGLPAGPIVVVLTTDYS